MKIKVLFFGITAEIIGTGEISSSDFKDTDTLNKYFQNKYPELKNVTYRIAVNQEIINENIQIE